MRIWENVMGPSPCLPDYICYAHILSLPLHVQALCYCLEEGPADCVAAVQS